ncbi:rRNA processing/ribosome biogenesis-domain-containing protein [Parachaetomium inaequale]|uniref:Pre-rRNA-processing protein RIX1 n=1 Tax=Parachaetomium inaequale TaxID=2588326 RepID=A0AAN6PLN6_9PEZI|nr:rRNA processing/ribosome biogenesis-domain-containing protein [Parachaetomium inaequale]
MTAPPDLRVLCRRLTAAPADDLPRLCPLLVSHVLRCGAPLSAPQDAKNKSSETPMLVHKLRTHITTLLTGRNASGRFAAVCLIKAVIDVGGWESLRASDPWLKGLIGVLQKPDPLASKELCIVTLTKIYMLLQGYQTLVREMVTPTLPSYVTACLQLIKPPASGKPLKVPAAFVDTVVCSLSKLVVLYPTTLRPIAAQMKTLLKAYVAPTSSDDLVVPRGLRDSSRRLSILLSYTAAKNGSSDEWVKAIRSTILDSHGTVDQLFRAVVESWESATGYRGPPVRIGTEPSGGSDSAPEELPYWDGVQSGAERLIGLLEFLAEYFNNPTKAPVTVPLGELLDLTARITLVTPPSGTEDSIETNPAIGRDEKAELWSVLPDIHVAVLRLHHALTRRLRENAVPLATDILDQMVRVSNASRAIPAMRETAYALTSQLLLLSGPTLPKLTVDSLAPLIQSTCRDILLSTGHLEPTPPQEPNAPKQQQQQQQHQKPNPNSTTPTFTNADAYLTTPSTTSSPPLTTTHLTSSTLLLPLFLSHLPQPHLAPELRGLLDRTAILAHSKEAMLASCLHPYRDSRGRYYPSILPFLVRQFPREQGVEVLRSNLVRWGSNNMERAGAWDPREGLEGLLAERKEDEDEEMGGGEEAEEGVNVGGEGGDGGEKKGKAKTAGGWGADTMDVDDDASGPAAAAAAESVNPFAAVTTTTTNAQEPQEVPVRPASPLKRKSEVFELDAGKPTKRVDTGKVAVMPKAKPAEEKADESGDESDSEGSVQIDMTLDDDEEEEEEEEEDDE